MPQNVPSGVLVCRYATIFPHYLIYGTILEKKFTLYKMCFDFLYNFF